MVKKFTVPRFIRSIAYFVLPIKELISAAATSASSPPKLEAFLDRYAKGKPSSFAITTAVTDECENNESKIGVKFVLDNIINPSVKY